MRPAFRGFWIRFLFILILATSLILTACDPSSQGDTTPQTVRIYASLPMSSTSKVQSQSLKNAMQLAIDEATGNTGTLGRFKIDFVTLDNSSPVSGTVDTNLEAANANKAANDPDTVFYLGPTSTAAAEVAIPILNKAGVPMISPGTTYPGLTKSIPGITKVDEPSRYYPSGSHNYFRLVPSDELQGRADASFTEAKLQSHNVYIVDDGGDYSVGLAKAYEQAASGYTIKLLGHDTLSSTDNTAIVTKVKNAAPQLVFFSGSSVKAAKFYNDLKATGFKFYFLSGNSIQDETFLDQVGTQASRIYSSVGGTDPSGFTTKGQDFVKAFEAKYGKTIEPSTVYGYDAMGIALQALKQSNQKDRSVLLKTLTGIRNYQGASGDLSFDQNGDTTLSVFSFYTDRNQKWIYDSLAETTSNGQNSTSNNQNAPPTVLATGNPNAAVRPSPNAASNLTPNANKRVDAASQLPAPFQLFKLADLPVAVYIPPASQTNGQPLQILIALHGMFANGGRFAAGLLDFAVKNHLVLLAPTFNYNVDYKNPLVISDEDVKLSAQLNQVVSQFTSLTHVNVKDKVMLFGFSRGAQLSHHYAMIYPNKVLGVAALSGGAYTLPLPDFRNQPAPFPYGISNFSAFAKENFDQADFVKIPFDVQVGMLDNDPAQVSRAWDSYIGVNRLIRGQNFYQGLLQDGVHAQFNAVPNTRHEVNQAQLNIAEKFLQGLVPAS